MIIIYFNYLFKKIWNAGILKMKGILEIKDNFDKNSIHNDNIGRQNANDRIEIIKEEFTQLLS